MMKTYMVIAIIIGIGLAIGLPFLAIKWDGHLHDPANCIRIQKIDDEYYAINSCTGKLEEVKYLKNQYDLN